MRVRELIAELLKCHQQDEVAVSFDDIHGDTDVRKFGMVIGINEVTKKRLGHIRLLVEGE